MKRFLLWSFERGSIQYDAICVVILAFIFLTPPTVFDDRPDFMRLPVRQAIRQTSDDHGKTVFIVKLSATPFQTEKPIQAAVDRLKASLTAPVTVSRTEPVYDTTGALVAYSIWVER